MSVQEQPESSISLEDKLSARRSARLGGFNDSSLVWLACVPAWTERLAQESQFPLGSFSTLGDFLKRAEDAGICQMEKRDNSPDLVQRSVRTMMALWARTEESDKPQVAQRLRDRAERLPAGPERRRVLREVEITAPVEQSGFRGTMSRAFGNEDKGAESRVLNAFQDAIADVKASGARAMSARVFEAATRVLGAKIVSFLSPVLALVATRAWQIEEVRDFFLRTAKELDPEERARLYLHAAENAADGWRRELQSRAVESIRAIDDPKERVEAYTEAIPELLDKELQQAAVTEANEMAVRVESPEQRFRLQAFLILYLPWLGGSKVTSLINDSILPGTLALTDPAQKTVAIANVAWVMASHGATVAAIVGLADSAEDPVSRAQILMEALPAAPDLLAEAVAEAVRGLQPAQLEKALVSLSVNAGSGIARLRTNDVFQAAISAAQSGRFATAGRISTFLPETGRASPVDRVLQEVDKLTSPVERLDALGQLAPYLPARVMTAAWRIASRLETDSAFGIAEPMRLAVLNYVRQKSGSAFVRDAVQGTGKGIIDALQLGVDAPAATARWAAIAELAKKPAEASALLTSQVRDTVERGSPGEALALLNLAAPLAELIGAELEPAMAISRQVVQLAYRQSADEKHLRRYLQREEQNQSFTELIEGSNDRWALHYMGMGGAGKTMLLRHLTARLAVKNGTRLATTRVDFDHISPDFPVRRPGELLASLAEELRVYGGPTQETRYVDFVSELNQFHGILSAEPPSEAPLKNIESEEFGRLLKQFAGLLVDLPKPVIFILDTCEELSKLEPEGAILPSVEATFRILERLQEMVPAAPATPSSAGESNRGGGLRVVFAGRRLLAQAGDKIPGGAYRWSAEAGSLSERNKLLPAAKDYLRLHLVRGFTEKETDNYFAAVAKIDPGPQRKAAILSVSREAGENSGIVWHDAAARTNEKEDRYNPFDVSLYAEWVRESPGVTDEMIGSGETDPYVRARIVDRILDEGVLHALPAAVLLRRFDPDMLRPVIGEESERQRIYRELGGQEWIDFQQNALQVQTNLLERVERYYRHESRRYLLDRARAALGPGLAVQLREALSAADPFAGLPIAKIDAALRLLPPREAALLWDEIDRTVTDRANWPWAGNVCRYLLSERNAAGADDSPLRAAVRATLAAVALHMPESDPTTLRRWWNEIARTARKHPMQEIGEWLTLRAEVAVGRAVVGGSPASLLTNWLALWGRDNLWRWEQLAVAVVASGTVTTAAKTTRLAAESVEDELPVEIRAFAAISRGDVKVMKTLAAQIPPGPTLQRWADWHAPASVRDRVRLEVLREGRKHAADGELKLWGEEAAAMLNNVDSERLLARTIQLRLDFYVPGLPQIATGSAIYDAARKPICDAHRSAPVLFAVMAEANLARGDDEAAEVLLRTKADVQDKEAATAASRGLALLSRRMRRPDAFQKLEDQYRVELPEATNFHYWWSTRFARDVTQVGTLVELVERMTPDTFQRKDGEIDPHSALDVFEVDLLGKRLGRETDLAVPLLAEAGDLSIADDFRVRVRSWALRSGEAMPELPQAPRRAAEIMLEEGELLALRLPDRALFLILEAANLFTKAGDAFGEFRCAVSAAYAGMAKGASPSSTQIKWAADAYAKCRAWLPRLPEWSEFAESNVWPGWAARILALQARFAEPDGGILTAASQARLETYCGAAPQFEVDIVRAVALPPAATKYQWLYMLIGFGAIAAAAWGGLKAVQWTFRNQETLAIVAGSAAAGAVYFWAFIGWFMPRLMVALYRWLRPVLRIERVEGDRARLALDIVDHARWLFPKVWPMISVTVALPSSNPYARPDGEGWRELRKRSFLRVLTSPVITRMPLVVIVDRSLARYPWEASLNLLVGRCWFDETLQMVRQGTTDAIQSRIEQNMKGVDVYCRTGLAPALETAWDTGRLPVKISPSRKTPQHLLHAVGTVQKTASGMRFLVGKGGETESGTSWGPERFEGSEVVVVQEEPAERVRRLDVDRERTADMREWALAAFESQVKTVVMLPAMPLELAGLVAKKMADRLRRGWRPTSLFGSLNLMNDIQGVIRGFKVPEGKDGLVDLRAKMTKKEISSALRELSLEVTLFMRSPEADPGNRFTGFRRSFEVKPEREGAKQ